MSILYKDDGDVSIIRDKNITIIGYGSQGRAHALNLRDSGLNISIGLRPGRSWETAMDDGFVVQDVSLAVREAHIVMLLLPDENMKAVYDSQIKSNIRTDVVLAFAHGFNIHYNQISPGPGADVIMIAPKAPGYMVRETYLSGHGVPHLIAMHQDRSGHARDVAIAYAVANGAGSAGILETTFQHETESDLFGEQAVLCGGLVELMKTGFEVLVNNGYAPELAYFECVHEMKLIVDLIYTKGIAGLNQFISNNAEYGEYMAGPKVINRSSREAMENLLQNIRSGQYAKDFILEGASNLPILLSNRKAVGGHLIEIVGKELRSKMTWLKT